MKVLAARQAAALGWALLAAAALLALRSRGGAKAQRPLAASGYDLADGRGRVLMGRRLRLMAYVLRLPVVGALLCRLMAKGKRGLAVCRFASRIPDAPLYYPYMDPEAPSDSRAPALLLPGASSLADFSRASLADAAGASPFRHWTIADYTSRYESGALTPTQVVEAALRWVAANEAGAAPLKLFAELRPEDALAQARASSERYACGRPRGVLDGVPVAVKDSLDVRGYRTQAGTSFLGDVAGPASEDAVPVARLRAAGAVLLGKTNMHELGAGVTGFNAHHGTTRNPHDPRCYAGGSSSGSAAAVACGLVPVAVGQDGGGSTRVPAALCGVVGLKPTFQRIPPLSAGSPSLSHTGPIAGCVRDVAVAYAVMSGPDGDFPRGVSQPPPDLRSFGGTERLDGVRVAFFPRYNDHSAPEVAAATRAALRALESRGCELVEVALPHLAPIHMAHSITIASEFALMVDRAAEARGSSLAGGRAALVDKLSPEAQMVLTMANQCSGKDFVAAQRVRAFALRQFREQVLRRADVLVTPTAAITAPEIPREALAAGEVNAEQQAAIVRYSWYSNMIGTPAVTVPVAFDARGLPIGVQLQAAHWGEDLLLRLAHALERDHAHQQRPPAVYATPLGEPKAQ